ncbi:uncharacterized protein LOC127266234 [Andrographis paniculata]|uniref:uncharacterized protein LOC127266234 n=1 Tax=Andrographis paniculata TaxID=175694 RepID=UPI0021E8092C|nr:uncharacterized protein LOC127266234 [Andrographis paniculata]
MENGPPTPGLDDGTIDVERLLGEPQDGHESMDSMICFNEKIQANGMDMEDVSCSFGCTDAAIARERKDILRGEVLEVMPSEVEAGYYRLHSDFCSMGEDYLLGSGVDFDEGITNLGYGSSGGFPAAVSDNQMPVSSAGSDSAWKSDLFRITEEPDCSNDQFTVRSSELSDIPNCHDCQMRVEEKPSVSHRFTSRTIGNYNKSSSCSFRETLSDENGGRLTPLRQMLCSQNVRNNHEFELTDQEVKTNTCDGHKEEAKLSVKASGIDDLTTQKRSRKPTQRYIDELPDPFSTFSKKRRSLAVKEKPTVVKDKKKCPIGSKELRFLDEESSVKAIQVPFASLVHKECPKEQVNDSVQPVDSRKLMPISKCKRVTPENQNEIVPAARPKVKDYCAPAQKKREACVTTVYKKKRNGRITAGSQKKWVNCIIDDGPKNRNDNAAVVSPKKREEHFSAKPQKKRDCLDAESLEEANGRRKHHRLWTISEVKKLIDGVAQYGVGRWSRIKKLFFSSSAHRTSVDLKDKWRNLLKASGIQEQGSQQGEKKRSVAWRPLPKSILRRVCELATLYPYPKGQRPKIGGHSSNIIVRDSSPDRSGDTMVRDSSSPDRSADITLSDYRRILRSINGNE